MEYDLLIRGGRVVDGSGFSSYLADVGRRIFDPQRCYMTVMERPPGNYQR